MSKYAQILSMEKENFHSLVFDLTQFNNVEQYYGYYDIPTNEQMLVYAYSSRFSSFTMEGNGTIITDQAIYFHPSHTDWAESNRISLDGLCQFLIFQENSYDTVHLISPNKDYSVFGRTVAPSDTTSSEFVLLLQHLQKNMMLMNEKDRKTYHQTIGWVMDSIRNSFHEYGILALRYQKYLDMIAKDTDFQPMVIMLWAEHFYRMCDESVYFHYLFQSRNDIPIELYHKLEYPDEFFFEDYITDISQVNSFFLTNPLIDAYVNLKKKERLTLHQCIILCFLCIRMDDLDYFYQLLDMVSNDIDEEMFWRIQCFRARFLNENMSKVYEKLFAQVDISGKELDFSDSLGLTPLHYAIIMGDKKRIHTLLVERNWYDDHSPFLKDKLVDTVYDYMFTASILHDDIELIEDVYSYTVSAAYPLRRTMKQLDLFLFINQERLNKEQDKIASMMKLREDALIHGRSEVVLDFDNKLKECKENCKEYLIQLKEYHLMRDEVEEELHQLSYQAMMDARAKFRIIFDTKHPFAMYLIQIYLDKEAIYRNIADTFAQWKLYRYKHLYFITSITKELDLSYYEWLDSVLVDVSIREGEVGFATKEHDTYQYHQFEDGTYENPYLSRQKQKEKMEREKKRCEQEEKKRSVSKFSSMEPHEDSWFSPEAHSSLKILKKEYRMLVKKYHPDVSVDTSSLAFMQAIMTERADILEQMK